MNGKILVSSIVGPAILVGAAIYYLQVYAFYDKVELSSGAALPGTTTVQLTSLMSGAPEPILVEDFQGIDSDSSPLRFRGCFTTPMSLALLSETYVAYDAAEPRIAPGWFDCFDAEQIGNDLHEGLALPFLSVRDITSGFDRVIAVYGDGRAFAWHQPNDKFAE